MLKTELGNLRSEYNTLLYGGRMTLQVSWRRQLCCAGCSARAWAASLTGAAVARRPTSALTPSRRRARFQTAASRVRCSCGACHAAWVLLLAVHAQRPWLTMRALVCCRRASYCCLGHVAELYFKTKACLRSDQSTCPQPGDPLHDITHSGLDALVRCRQGAWRCRSEPPARAAAWLLLARGIGAVATAHVAPRPIALHSMALHEPPVALPHAAGVQVNRYLDEMEAFANLPNELAWGNDTR